MTSRKLQSATVKNGNETNETINVASGVAYTVSLTPSFDSGSTVSIAVPSSQTVILNTPPSQTIVVSESGGTADLALRALDADNADLATLATRALDADNGFYLTPYFFNPSANSGAGGWQAPFQDADFWNGEPSDTQIALNPQFDLSYKISHATQLLRLDAPGDPEDGRIVADGTFGSLRYHYYDPDAPDEFLFPGGPLLPKTFSGSLEFNQSQSDGPTSLAIVNRNGGVNVGRANVSLFFDAEANPEDRPALGASFATTNVIFSSRASWFSSLQHTVYNMSVRGIDGGTF